MKLAHDFTVHAPPEQAWDVLLDVERVAPCLPGAALEGGDGTEYAGTMTIKLGPVTRRYRARSGSRRPTAPARRAVMRAQARDARGDGTAAATITTRLEAATERTRVRVETDLAISGPAAQFGRGVMQDVSGRLMGEFAACLAERAGRRRRRGRRRGAAAANGAALAGIEYEDTQVGRLPVGPAGDAALAAAGANAGANDVAERQGRAARPRCSTSARRRAVRSPGARCRSSWPPRAPPPRSSSCAAPPMTGTPHRGARAPSVPPMTAAAPTSCASTTSAAWTSRPPAARARRWRAWPASGSRSRPASPSRPPRWSPRCPTAAPSCARCSPGRRGRRARGRRRAGAGDRAGIEVPPALRDAITAAYTELGDGTPVAVRSCACAEDSQAA